MKTFNKIQTSRLNRISLWYARLGDYHPSKKCLIVMCKGEGGGESKREKRGAGEETDGGEMRRGEIRGGEGRRNIQRNSDSEFLKSPNRCKADTSNLYAIKLYQCNKCKNTKKIKKPSENKIINRKRNQTKLCT